MMSLRRLRFLKTDTHPPLGSGPGGCSGRHPVLQGKWGQTELARDNLIDTNKYLTNWVAHLKLEKYTLKFLGNAKKKATRL